MHQFELAIFIDCKRDDAYDHLAKPINMLGLQPLLTEIDVLRERNDENGIILRPFHTVETFRLAGLPIIRNKVLYVIHLTKPKEELDFHVYKRPNIEMTLRYTFRQFNDGRTQISQTVQVVKVNKLLEYFVMNQAKQTQRALFSNLKVRLEKH